MTRKKIGLALGSGGARGLAHIGVIKKLCEYNIPIDYIAGSSIGSLIGGLYAATGDIYKVEQMAANFNWQDWFKTFSDIGFGNGLLKGEKAENRVRDLVDDVNIEDLKIKMCATATDLNTAESIIIDKGSLAKAIRASTSVPVLFQPEKFDNHILVDGGLSCPVPVEAVKEMGADVVIAVNLDSIYFLPENRQDNRKSSLFSVSKNSLFLLRYHLAEKEVKEADIVINPKIPYLMDLDFIHKEEIVADGEKAAEQMIPEIQKLVLEKRKLFKFI